MSRTRPIGALLLLTLLVVSCSSDDADGSSTTTVDRVTTTTRAAATTTNPPTGTTLIDRTVDVVECDAAPDDSAIVCEAFDLIQDVYVDDIDATTLAEAASDGLRLLDGADNDATLVCAAPSDEFSSTCDVAAIAADDAAEAAEAMVAGMTSFALDPNSGYFDPDALDLLQEEQRGEIQGIGALVSPEDQTIPGDNKQCGVISETCEILIVSTIEGAPAETVGLLRDDEIVAVDGEPILGWTVDEVTATVRGPSGTDVTLTIERQGELLDVTITRAAVQIPVIEDEVIGDVGYLRLWNFTGTAGSQFEEALVDLLAADVDEIVVDLRNNPGGFLTTAIDVTSLFLADGDVVMTQGPEGTINYPVNGSAIVPDDVKVTFVLNKGSASASEVVSATLQERGRATVVGENSFGKNTVQQRFGLSNDGALKLTIARWLTPAGHDFGGTGVVPDVVIDDVTSLDAAELVDAIAGT
ncbi:MAG: S41 family peptidase [Acidimicrobiia bacterium]